LSNYRVVVRHGAKVERAQLDSLEAALDSVESRARELSENADAGVIDTKLRKFDPIQQVVGRVELAGPKRLRAGIDVRGDGSVESYTGRLRRRLIEQRRGESAYEALRRAVAAEAGPA
jgi:hypothetical protein